MRVRYASRIVTRVFTLLVITASLTTIAGVSATLSVQTSAQEPAAQEVPKTEREQREAFLRSDIAKIERLVADEFIFTNGRDIGDSSFRSLKAEQRSRVGQEMLSYTRQIPASHRVWLCSN